MKHFNFNSINIFLICLLILFFSIFLILTVTDNNKNNYETNLDKITIGNAQNSSYTITLFNSKLNKKLKKYLQDTYEVSINKINENFIYGDIHDTSSNNNLFVTKYIFKYNFENDEFEIYKFNYNYRILNYFILNETIYASLIFKNPLDNISYNWSIIKFDKTLKDGHILKEGTIIDPISTPIFHYSNENKQLYAVAINENFKSENDIIAERKQILSIYQIENEIITTIKEYNGDVLNKTGTMLCSIFEVQIYKNEMLLCTTDYINSQDIKSIDLITKKEVNIFSNNLKKDWIITSFQRNDKGIYIGKINTQNSQRGKTTYYNFETKKIQETNSSVLYGRTPFLKENMLFHNLEKWSFYNSNENKFFEVQITGNYKDAYLYPTFYVLNENTILTKSNNNQFYIGILNF